MDSSPIDSSAPSETTTLPGDGTRKRPTRITAELGYNDKPKRLTGLKIILGFIVAILVAISLRMLAAPGGGPLMAAYNYVAGLFGSGSPS